MKRSYALVCLVLLCTGCWDSGKPPVTPVPVTGGSGGTAGTPSEPGLIVMDQGVNWTRTARASFYSQDQGSRLIPFSWLQALKQPDGGPFLADHLSRYGYLSNIEYRNSKLPVGFALAELDGVEYVGMTCAACHTRQIDVGDKSYRIDGGPAIADFQSFVSDLDTAVANVLAKPQAFQEFAKAALPQPSTADDEAKLKVDVAAWHLPFHTIMSRALPPNPWGPSRLNALGMIFNRLTGLDIGTGPDHMIPENIHVADAPARYPFLWNASIQDLTQWPGIAENGDALLALARNLGEVYGVFGKFHPRRDSGIPVLGVDYITDNSANFKGLETLENLIKNISPPKFPWKIDEELASEGEAIFNRDTKSGGCVECHGIRPGKVRLLEDRTWDTPIVDVGTDTREFNLLSRTADSGVLAGALDLGSGTVQQNAPATTLLSIAVLGEILERPFKDAIPLLDARSKLPGEQEFIDRQQALLEQLQPKIDHLKNAFRFRPEIKDGILTIGSKEDDAGKPKYGYESRVMEGIWAAAPYLHNGSVPTLQDLLKPAAERPESFMVGPEYDPQAVGLAKVQKKFNFTLKTTGAEDLNSGNSRAGHEYGTTLPKNEKRALLEYLKKL